MKESATIVKQIANQKQITIDVDEYFAVKQSSLTLTVDDQTLHARRIRNRDTNLEPSDNAIVIDLDADTEMIQKDAESK